MKTRNPLISAMLLGLGLFAFSATASARDHGDHHGGHRGYEHHHDHYYNGHYGRDVRVVERRYYGPVYQPVYERRAPIYRAEPGVVVHIGLPLPPPIFFPFH